VAGHSGVHPSDLETLRINRERLRQIIIQGNRGGLRIWSSARGCALSTYALCRGRVTFSTYPFGRDASVRQDGRCSWPPPRAGSVASSGPDRKRLDPSVSKC
jgi:hypothetical protein